METLWNRGHASEAMRAPGSIGWNGMPMEVRESYGLEIIRAPVRVGVDGVQAVPGGRHCFYLVYAGQSR